MCLFVCLSPSCAIFFCVHGLVRSALCPWTGAECPLPSRGALKTGRCSELDASTPPPLWSRGSSMSGRCSNSGLVHLSTNSYKNKELFRIAHMHRPRVGGVRLEDWCTRRPTHRALKRGVVLDCIHGSSTRGRCSTSGLVPL